MLKSASQLTDVLEHLWEEHFMRRAAGTILVVVYLGMIGIIELNRNGWLPPSIGDPLPRSHFFAVEVAFVLLLITEVISLIFGLTRSFSRSIGIQLQILSLIFLRDTFKKFTGFGEPLQWELVSDSVVTMIADVIGALTIFVILGIYYRIQKRRPITDDDVEQSSFIAYKKLIALGLIVIFTLIGVVDIYRFLTGQEVYPFFDTFYTVLIFTDVLMVLISLRYSNNFAVIFRNFGYAVVTVFIRLALVAPTPVSVGLGVGAALFTLGMAYAYNQYGQEIMQQESEASPYAVKSGD